jgi:CRP-like cAMP-binding protein
MIPNRSTADWTDLCESSEFSGMGVVEGKAHACMYVAGVSAMVDGFVGLRSMALEALVDPLQRVVLFQGLAPLQLADIARLAQRIVFRPGDKIIEEGEAGDAAFLIADGDAVRTSGPVIQGAVERVPPGSLVGEMAMLIETEHTSTVVAEGTVRALKITRASLHGQMLEDPSLAEHFVTKITGRLLALAEELREIDRALAVESGREAGHYVPALTLESQRPGLERQH